MSAAPPSCVAVYRRRLAVSLERVFENVRDWEHLPWLHRASFRSIELLDSGAWGWRARVGLPPADAGPEIEIELLLEQTERRYVARTLRGPGAGSEIWTRLEPVGAERTDVEVEFRIPGVEPGAAASVGAAYTALYTRLWDEDESMMRRRAWLLASAGAAKRDAEETCDLGPLDALRARLPCVVELGGQSYRILELDGAIVAHSSVCPHMLGPLDAGEIVDGCVVCPWHGYRFDLRSGRSADGRGLRLAPAARVEAREPSGTLLRRERR